LRGVNEYFDTDFATHQVSDFRKSIGHAAFPRLESEISGQRKKAACYCEAFKNTPGIRFIPGPPDSRGSYPYFTLIFDDAPRRNKVLGMLQKSGLGASEIYALAITDYDYLKTIIPRRDCPSGRFLAAHHLTLSTSVFLKEEDLEKIITIIKKS